MPVRECAGPIDQSPFPRPTACVRSPGPCCRSSSTRKSHGRQPRSAPGREAEQKITYLLEMSSRDDLRPPRQPAVPFQVNPRGNPLPRTQLVPTPGRGGRVSLGRAKTGAVRNGRSTSIARNLRHGSPAWPARRRATTSSKDRPTPVCGLSASACSGNFSASALGGALLASAVQRCWELGATRVWLRTSSHDHPHALQNYLARGFTLVSQTSSAAKSALRIGMFGLRAME